MPKPDGVLVTPTPCCTRLRCKTMYCRSDERAGLLHASETMTYWCSHTNEDIGKDGEIATHAECQPGRGCYEPPV